MGEGQTCFMPPFFYTLSTTMSFDTHSKRLDFHEMVLFTLVKLVNVKVKGKVVPVLN
jgi:hypothetical protein